MICFGFTIDLSDKGFLYRDLLDADLGLLKTDIDSFPVNIFLVSKMSGRRLQDISRIHFEDLFVIRLEDVFLVSKISGRRIQDMSSRHLEDLFVIRLKDVLEDKKDCCVEEVFKISWRLLLPLTQTGNQFRPI